MIALLIAVVAAAAVAFGLLGYITGRRYKPETRGLLWFVMALVLVAILADVASGFQLGMSHILGPWLFGVGVGLLRYTGSR
jgi:hypothetical protein